MKLTSITLSIVGIFIALACANGLLQLSGKARGDFVIIGSFCVPRKVTGVEKLAEGKSSDSKSNPTLTVHVTSGDSSLKNQKLLLYTDYQFPTTRIRPTICFVDRRFRRWYATTWSNFGRHEGHNTCLLKRLKFARKAQPLYETLKKFQQYGLNRFNEFNEMSG